MNDELEMILVLSAWGLIEALFWNLLDRLEKTKKNLIQYSQCIRWDKNKKP